MIELTKKQKSVRDFIAKSIAKNSWAPTTREIQKHFGFASQNAAVNHLKALVRKGAVARLKNSPRAIAIVP